MECHQLIEKITNRISTVYSKQLSYAGRLQVVTSILFLLHSFWGATFIQPQSVLKEVNKKCREYLWGNIEGKRKISPVAWDGIYCLKKFGGLNNTGSRLWNIAFVGKLFWQIANKKDSMWMNGCMGFI